MAHSTPPKSISLKQTVEGESIRLQRRFNEDHYLFASGGLWLLMGMTISLFVGIGFFTGLVAGGGSAILFMFGTWLILEGVGLNLYGTSPTRSGQVTGGLFFLIISLIIACIVIIEPVVALWFPLFEYPGLFALGLTIGLALITTVLSIGISYRRGRLGVTADRIRLTGRDAQDWLLASVIEIKADEEQILINGKVVKGLEGLTATDRNWVVEWLQEFVRVRVEEVGAAAPGRVPENPPEDLVKLVGTIDQKTSES